MQPIYLLVGPPAVGKSSASKALASKFSRSMHIPVDDIRDMVVSGLVLPGLDWSRELVQQVGLARESVIHMACTYQKVGFAVVIDDFFDPNQLSEYQAFADQPEIHKVLLLPEQETAHARNLKRSGDDPAREYIDIGIRSVYAQVHASMESLRAAGWILIDTTHLSIEETVFEILSRSSA